MKEPILMPSALSPRPLRTYVSGPMSGIAEHNHPAFHDASLRLRGAGHYVISPAEMNTPRDCTWEEYLIADLQLLMHCDAIALLPGWEKSRGACFELYVALQLQLKVFDATTLKPLCILHDVEFTTVV